MPSDLFCPTRATPLPSPTDDWFHWGAFNLLIDGSLTFIRTQFDFPSRLRHWHDEKTRLNIELPQPNLSEGRLRIYSFDGSKEQRILEVPVVEWPIASRLSDGRWLISSLRAQRGDEIGYASASYYDAAGRLLEKRFLGSGINQILCAGDGTFWIGYDDQGTNGPAPCGEAIARFGADSSVLWMLNASLAAAGLIEDNYAWECYALTLADNVTWTCCYSSAADFPIVSIEGGSLRMWRNGVYGARALAVDGDHVLLASGYKPHGNRLAVVKLEADEARLIGELRAPFDLDGAALLQGQRDTLHIVHDGLWWKIRVQDVMERLSN